MDFKARLMVLVKALRDPTGKPPVNAELDRRLDEVDRRLKVLSPESARRARNVVHQGR